MAPRLLSIINNNTTDASIISLRELPATSVILGMCAGRWGRSRSSSPRKNSPKVAKIRMRREWSLTIAFVSAGDHQIPSTYKGIWPKKSPIGTWDAAVRRAKRPIGMPRKQRTLRTADAHLSITIAPGSMSTYIPKNRPWVPKSAPELSPAENE